MGLDKDPFPAEMNTVDFGVSKGKAKVLTSAKAREAGTVDPEM